MTMPDKIELHHTNLGIEIHAEGDVDGIRPLADISPEFINRDRKAAESFALEIVRRWNRE